MDFLATKVIDALQKTHMEKSWIEEKKTYFTGMDRLSVLRSLSNFDDENLGAICSEIGVDVSDMAATLRVLRKI